MILFFKLFHNRLNHRQHFIGMALEVDIVPDLLDFAIGADEDGTAENTHKLLAVALPFAPEAQLIQHDMADIGQQRKV